MNLRVDWLAQVDAESLATIAELQSVDTDEDTLKRVESRATTIGTITTADLQEVDMDEDDVEDFIVFDEDSNFDDLGEASHAAAAEEQASQTTGAGEGKSVVVRTVGPALSETWDVFDDAANQLEEAFKLKVSAISQDGLVSNKTKNKLSKEFESAAVSTYSRMWRGLNSAKDTAGSKADNMRQGLKTAQGKMAVMSKSMWTRASCTQTVQTVHSTPSFERRSARISV
jgi:hypothetical protein